FILVNLIDGIPLARKEELQTAVHAADNGRRLANGRQDVLLNNSRSGLYLLNGIGYDLIGSGNLNASPVGCVFDYCIDTLNLEFYPLTDPRNIFRSSLKILNDLSGFAQNSAEVG